MRRPVFLSTLLFAAVLSPITLQPYTCGPPPVEAKLAVLELRVGSFAGENVIEGFNPNVFSYDVRFPESESVGVLWVKTNHPSTKVDVEYDGLPVQLVGQSVAKLEVPLGQSELTLVVTRRGATTDTNTYVVRILRAPIFACTEQGIRDAIAYGGGPNYFDCDGPTVVPTEAEIVIDNDVILDGEGNMIVDAGGGGGGAGGAGGAGLVADEVAPKANGPHRVFYIPEGVTAELIGLTVTGGSTDGDGGGILNGGTFAVTSSTVTGNTAGRAGGIGNLETGTLTVAGSTVSNNSADLVGGFGNQGLAEVIDTTVSGNTATVDGGGVANATAATLTLTNAIVEGNTAGRFAGGVGTQELGTVTLNNTLVLGNHADEVGGGIFNGGIMTLNDSEVSRNSATEYHGGINNDGVLMLNSTTVSENSTGLDGGGLGNQGAVTLNNSTVSDNTAGLHGGGLANSGTLTLTNSTVLGNEAMTGGGGGVFTISGTVTLTDTTVSGNATNNPGGGIWVFGGALALTNSTVSANQSAGGGGIMNEGTLTLNGATVADNDADVAGGISNFGTLTVSDSTVSANTSVVEGGGLLNYDVGSATLAHTTVEGNTSGQLGGGISNDGAITLMDTTVRGNQAVPGRGGGIYQNGTMVLTNSEVTDNTAVYGGGVWNLGGSLELTNSTVSGNSAIEAVGGGIANEASMTLLSSTVTANTAATEGGGIFSNGEAILTDTTVALNMSSVDGGGILSRGALTLSDSSVTGNSSNSAGGMALGGTTRLKNTVVSGNTGPFAGGIANGGPGILVLENSTVSGNIATTATGGGIWNQPPASATLQNATVSGNLGGGILNEGTMTLVSVTLSDYSPGAPAIENAIDAFMIARNTIVDGECFLFVNASLGGNIETEGFSCGFIPPDDQSGVPRPSLNLQPLGNNGGPTQTHALLAPSVAIDQIAPTDCVDADGQPLTTDQRGEPRPVAILGPEPKCDVGAFEVQLGGTGGTGGTGGSGGTGGAAGGCVYGAQEHDAITCINGEAPPTDAGTVYFNAENCADATNTVYDLTLANADGVTQVYLWAGIENAGCEQVSNRSDVLAVCREVAGNPRIVGYSATVFDLTLQQLIDTGIVDCNNTAPEGQPYEIYSFRDEDPGGTDVAPDGYGVAPFKVLTPSGTGGTGGSGGAGGSGGIGSRDVCEICVADGECGADGMPSDEYRCVPMYFPEPPTRYPDGDTGFCLKIVGPGGCEQPYAIAISNRPSLSDPTLRSYCGISEALATCSAVRALDLNETCPSGSDAECPVGGLCRDVGGLANRCTYRCSIFFECSEAPAPGSTCSSSGSGGDDYCGG